MRALVVSSIAMLLSVSVSGAAGPPPKPDPRAEMEAMVRRLSFAPPPGKDAKAELELLARKLPFFQTHMFIYDTDHHQMPGEVYAAYEKVVRLLYRRAYPVASLLPLLKHPDPRVRTLAAAGLYAYENPRLLLELVPLLEDRAEAFPEVSAPSNFTIYSGWYKMPPMEQQTVGGVARQFLDIYLRAAGYQEGIAPGNGRPGLADYWARRKGRTYCASWFAVRLIRACRGYLPSPKDRYPEIRVIRKEIDKLPDVDRALTLLWLSWQWGGDLLVSEKELVEACKRIGPDRLLELLRGKPLNNDPDIYQVGRKRHDLRISGVILPNAKQLFRPKDADAIISCASVEGNYPTAEWFIAAANLQPKRAGSILDQGWESSKSLRIAFARWRILPEEGTTSIVKRFYDQPLEYATFPHSRGIFLRELGENWEANDRKLLVELVRSKRFATLDWQSLETLAYLVNRVEKKVVIDPKELHATRHPLGQSHAEWPLMEAEKKYPKETAELKRRLETWRTLLRKALLDP